MAFLLSCILFCAELTIAGESPSAAGGQGDCDALLFVGDAADAAEDGADTWC